MSINYGMQNNVAKNLLFIDGISRVGKSLFSGIIPSLNKMEHIQFYTLLEHIVPAVGLGSIDINFAKSFLRTNMNELAYNIKLSRNVNFRFNDQTGVLSYKNPKLYFERLNKDEGSNVIDELQDSNWHVPFQTHDLMVNLEHLNKLEIDYRLIEVFRNPCDIVYSWWKRGWGERFGSDPHSFTLVAEFKGVLLPWYCAGIEEKWLHMNPVERCVRLVIDLSKRSITQFRNAANKNDILLLTFEQFVRSPHDKIKEITAFLETSTTEITRYHISKANCPRIIDLDERNVKIEKIKDSISGCLFNELKEFTDYYEDNCYNLLA